MAPLHHHFELSGWHENQVVVRFWIVAVIFSILSRKYKHSARFDEQTAKGT